MRQITTLMRVSLIAILLIVCARVAYAEDKLPFAPPKDSTALPPTALIETNKGRFEIKFFREDAPVTVRNFQYLAQKKYYDKIKFYSYVQNYILQTGDPDGNGKGGPGYTLPPEFSSRRHHKGTIGMARKQDQFNPERRSNGSQFYICLTDAPHLDGFYTIFAEVISGMEVVEKLREDDFILQIHFPRSA